MKFLVFSKLCSKIVYKLMQSRTIADTNAFYGLATGKVKAEWFACNHLTATTLTAIEFGKSYNTVNKIGLVRDAANSLKSNCGSIIMDDVFDFATARIIPGYKYNRQKWNHAWDAFDLILTHTFIQTEQNMVMAKQIIEDYEKPFRDSIDAVNASTKPEIPEEIRAEFKAHDFTRYFRKMIAEMLEKNHLISNPGQPISIDIDAEGWNDLELFVAVWADFQKKRLLTKTMKLQYNDWIDMWNMAYVGRNDLYFTMEKKWINIIKANPSVAQYLHSKSGFKV